MNFDYITLKCIYENRHYGDFPPYSEKSASAVERYVLDAANDLAVSEILDVLVAYGDLESGYATYISVFCYKKQEMPLAFHHLRTLPSGYIQVHISANAPVAIWGAEIDICPELAGTLPEGDWSAEIAEMTTKLYNWRFTITDSQTLSTPIPFEVDLKNYNRSNPPYRVFDLLFRWDD